MTNSNIDNTLDNKGFDNCKNKLLDGYKRCIKLHNTINNKNGNEQNQMINGYSNQLNHFTPIVLPIPDNNHHIMGAMSPQPQSIFSN